MREAGLVTLTESKRAKRYQLTVEGRKCRHADAQTCRHDEKVSALAEDDGSADTFEPVSSLSASACLHMGDIPDGEAVNDVCTSEKPVSALSALAARPFGYAVTQIKSLNRWRVRGNGLDDVVANEEAAWAVALAHSRERGKIAAD